MNFDLDDFDFDGLMTFIENNIGNDGRFYRGRLADYDGRLVKNEHFFDKVFSILGNAGLIQTYGIIRDFGNRAAYDSIRVSLKNK